MAIISRKAKSLARLRLLRPETWTVLVMALCPFAAMSSRAHDIDSIPSSDFSRHSIIYPKIFHGREKRQISTTNEKNGYHTEKLVIKYNLDDNQYTLDLILNKELIPKNAFIEHQKDGRSITTEITEKDINLCQYTGKIRGIDESWAAISTCNGLNGVVHDGHSTHYLQSGKDDSLSAPHFLYKNEHFISNYTCGYKNKYDFDYDSEKFPDILRHKRSNDIFSVKGPFNSNKNSRYVEFVFVVDHKSFRELGSNIENVYSHCREIANIMNVMYMPLNIFIALIGVVVWSEGDQIEISGNGDNVLNDFLNYRRERLYETHPNDNAQLLTRKEMSGSVVGKALKGPICTFESSGGIIVEHSDVVGVVATTAAHELGHNFGMEHDNDYCECPETKCIMSSTSSPSGLFHWSKCSLEYLSLNLQQGMDYCLRNKPESLFASAICGNGFVEHGEQCDCGMSQSCDENICCNSKTCMLYPNATCATGECCDQKTCQILSTGVTCRNSEYECDLPEYCDGVSEYCPFDVYKMDGVSCNAGKSYCYQGTCRSKNDECRLLWGPSGKNGDDICYDWNKNGNSKGNCGYDLKTKKFEKCLDEDKFCGLLHCQHLNEKLEFGMEGYAITSYFYVNLEESLVVCRTALVDLGSNHVKVGLVPNGAKCGEGKMCLDQKCLPVNMIKNDMISSYACRLNCYGNGICNSLGHCHCDEGYGPPFCNVSGSGGSLDSGSPIQNYSYLLNIFICLIVLSVAVIIFIIIFKFCRNDTPTWWQKPEAFSYVKNSTSKCCAFFTCGAGGIKHECSSSYNSNNNSKDITNNINKINTAECEVFIKNGETKKKPEKPNIVKGGLISTTNEHVQNNFAFYKSRVLSIRRSSLFSRKDDKRSSKNIPNISSFVANQHVSHSDVAREINEIPSTSNNFKQIILRNKNTPT